MGKYGPDIGPNIGNSTRMPGANGAHNFQRSYYKSVAAAGSDVRAHYEDLYFNGVGGGEVLRVRGIANTLLCATTGTINAIHATGRVAAAKTVSGELNAIRATLEVAGTNPTPGGTLAALQVDSNIVTGWTAGANDSFIRVGNTGAGLVGNLFYISDAIATKSDTAVVTTLHGDHAATHGIKIRAGSTTMWLLAATDVPSA
jgi:hypothetical protein